MGGQVIVMLVIKKQLFSDRFRRNYKPFHSFAIILLDRSKSFDYESGVIIESLLAKKNSAVEEA